MVLPVAYMVCRDLTDLAGEGDPPEVDVEASSSMTVMGHDCAHGYGGKVVHIDLPGR